MKLVLNPKNDTSVKGNFISHILFLFGKTLTWNKKKTNLNTQKNPFNTIFKNAVNSYQIFKIKKKNMIKRLVGRARTFAYPLQYCNLTRICCHFQIYPM